MPWLAQNLLCRRDWPQALPLDLPASASQELKVCTPPFEPSFQMPTLFFFKTCSHTGLELIKYTEPQQSSCLCLSSKGITDAPCCALHLGGCWEPNLGLLVCASSTLPTVPSPQALALLSYLYTCSRKAQKDPGTQRDTQEKRHLFCLGPHLLFFSGEDGVWSLSAALVFLLSPEVLDFQISKIFP